MPFSIINWAQTLYKIRIIIRRMKLHKHAFGTHFFCNFPSHMSLPRTWSACKHEIMCLLQQINICLILRCFHFLWFRKIIHILCFYYLIIVFIALPCMIRYSWNRYFLQLFSSYFVLYLIKESKIMCSVQILFRKHIQAF